MVSNILYEYIGQITLKNLKDAILDLQVTEADTIILNAANFDDIVLEYRAFYGCSMPDPFIYLTVLIQDDTNYKVPLGRIAIIKDFL